MKPILATFAVVLFYVTVYVTAAPANDTEMSVEGSTSMTDGRNFNRMWDLLTALKSRIERLENRDDQCRGLQEVILAIGEVNKRNDGDDDEDDDEDENDDNKSKNSRFDDNDDKRSATSGKTSKKLLNSLKRRAIYRRGLVDGWELPSPSPGKMLFGISQLFREMISYWRDMLNRPNAFLPASLPYFTPGHHSHRPLPTAESSGEEQQNITKANITAYCGLKINKAHPPGKRMDIKGKIYLTETDGDRLVVSVRLTGLLPANSSTASQSLKHGFHIHQFGDLNNGCESTGPHFNPFNKTHGGPDSSKRHLGDLGNIETDSWGNIDKTLHFPIKNALSGPHSFIGKAIVIHERVDDLGSNPSDVGSMTTGNAGSRLACCVITKLD